MSKLSAPLSPGRKGREHEDTPIFAVSGNRKELESVVGTSTDQERERDAHIEFFQVLISPVMPITGVSARIPSLDALSSFVQSLSRRDEWSVG